MSVYYFDPLRDPRWIPFVERHARASLFHTTGWLAALRQTYGYHPIAYTTTAPGHALQDGVPFCRVESRLTGRRLVSLPFSDHCEPLLTPSGDADAILAHLHAVRGEARYRYVELRPLSTFAAEGVGEHTPFVFHRIDLARGLDEIYGRLHVNHIRRKIRRARRERLAEEVGASDRLLEHFYRLLLATRRRHQLPPQPRKWFRNLLDCLGDAARIRVAYKDARPVAAIITAAFRDTHYYKYGCSDPARTNLGGTAMLLWNAIQDATQGGARWFDLGRSDVWNQGLIRYKDRWGAEAHPISYLRVPPPREAPRSGEGWRMKVAKHVFARLPDRLLTLSGSVLYRHMG